MAKPALITFAAGIADTTELMAGELPFAAKRFYSLWCWGMKTSRTIRPSEHQLLIAVAGRVTVTAEIEYRLDGGECGLHVPPGNEIKITTERGAHLLVLCG